VDGTMVSNHDGKVAAVTRHYKQVMGTSTPTAGGSA
jgi:hypothetical protein